MLAGEKSKNNPCVENTLFAALQSLKKPSAVSWSVSAVS